jgi:UDPglucose 6-dehydrogenase
MEVYMKIAVAGTGYVGLVTGVALAEIGHNVTCVDIDEEKIKKMQNGISPIYEEDLENLMKKNVDRLTYTTNYKSAYKDADVIFIGVGTPERVDGSANLDYVFGVAEQIADSVEKNCVVVVKSTVPIGTNDKVEELIRSKIKKGIHVDVASNPEFLAQGTAVRDTLYASRIVVGTETERAKKVMEEVYEPFSKDPYNVPYLSMNRRSAEMVKYASNDFLALKISYINEIANFCEGVEADITDVTKGMGLDSRIGNKFLNAGLGYGGSCFPKDTKALHWVSKELGEELLTIKAAIEVNANQKIRLFDKLMKDYNNDIKGKKVAVLGLAFKPGTDDLREAPSIENVKLLLDYEAEITVYDPVALKLFEKKYGNKIKYSKKLEEAINGKDIVMIMTEWPDIVKFDLNKYKKLMKTPVIYDGRNCYSLEAAKENNLIYTSIGRKKVN